MKSRRHASESAKFQLIFEGTSAGCTLAHTFDALKTMPTALSGQRESTSG